MGDEKALAGRAVAWSAAARQLPGNSARQVMTGNSAADNVRPGATVTSNLFSQTAQVTVENFRALRTGGELEWKSYSRRR